jgi:selenocysteine lyase/cysteine desulfurase
MSPTSEELRALFVGLEERVPLLDGRRQVYVNFDNAATTPPFLSVLDHVNHCARWYSSVHRGTGHKSLLSSRAFEECRGKAMRFVGADPSHHTVVFCGNSTDAINRLCCRFPLAEDELVLCTVAEHHSNMLPWRLHGRVEYVRAKSPCGMLDLDDLEAKLKTRAGRVRLVATTGASNITGLAMPIHEIARIAHAHGAMVLVDAAQLIAHRAINMSGSGPEDRIDFLAFSAHKMYAPFGGGGLFGPRDFFKSGAPAIAGGGAVDLVSLDEVEWSDVPDKEEAGTPNLIGICAAGWAMDKLTEIGMDTVARHERELTVHALRRLKELPEIRVFGGCEQMDETDRLGVIPIQSSRYPHALLAAILGYEWGIGVRNGCFCAHPYVMHLLGIDGAEFADYRDKLRRGDRSELPGFVRISFGLYNTIEEIDFLVEALKSIHKNGPAGEYELDKARGQYAPKDLPPEMRLD